MNKQESDVQQEVQIEARHFDCVLMRNNSGACIDSEGQLVRYGLNNVSKRHQERSASSDLIGITSVVITPDMVGQTVGVLTAIEVKRGNWNPEKKLDKHEQAQANFIEWIKSLGGIASFCNDASQLKEILNFRNYMK